MQLLQLGVATAIRRLVRALAGTPLAVATAIRRSVRALAATPACSSHSDQEIGQSPVSYCTPTVATAIRRSIKSPGSYSTCSSHSNQEIGQRILNVKTHKSKPCQMVIHIPFKPISYLCIQSYFSGDFKSCPHISPKRNETGKLDFKHQRSSTVTSLWAVLGYSPQVTFNYVFCNLLLSPENVCFVLFLFCFVLFVLFCFF